MRFVNLAVLSWLVLLPCSRAQQSASPSSTQSAPTAGLVGYWPFDETSGSIAHDASGFANNGSLLCNGNCALPSWTTGIHHGALDFSSNNQSVTVADNSSLDFSNQFTISFWLYKTAGASNLYYFTKGTHIAIATASPESEMHAALYNGGTQVARCAIAWVVDQTWQHFAVTFNGANLVFYVNGVLNTTCSATGATGMPFSGAVNIGGPNTANPTGIMDEVRIYDTALTAQQIAAVYNDPGLSPVTVATSVALLPSGAALQSSGIQQFTATVTGSSNTAVTWSINPAIGSISSTGIYTAPSAIASSQTVTVTATSAAVPTASASASITLQPVVVSVSPSTATAQVSGTQQFTATVSGAPNTAISWSISPAVGSISSTGLYTAPSSIVTSQTVTVIAASAANSSASASASITLQPVVVSVSPSTANAQVSGIEQFTATVSGDSNTAVTWAISPAVGSISSTGLYTAPHSIGATQTVTVTATSSADATKSAAATITLQPVVVTLSPATAAEQINGTQQFNATVGGSTNTAIPWSLSPAVGTISNSGLYTAPGSISAGQTVTVTATSAADATKFASAAITLQPVVITLSPETAMAQVSGIQEFTATVTGTSNTTVTWSLSPGVGTIFNAGLYTAPASISAAQTVTVTATSAADATKFASAAITLQPVAVTLSPATAMAQVSGTQQFTAVVTGSSNVGVTWSLSPAVGTISASGLYTAPGSTSTGQTVTVTATSAADATKSASAAITLQPVAVTLSPATATAQVSGTQQFTAVVTGSSNTTVTWSLSPALGTISSAGLYTAPASISAAQTVTVTATSSADSTKSASAAIALQPVVITLSPETAMAQVSSTQQFTAVVTGSSNAAVTWSLSPALGTISSSGLYTAPGSISTGQTVTVTATNFADTASATITLQPVLISISPGDAAPALSGTQQFTATVTNAANTAVSWSLSPALGSISSTGLYTAPSSISAAQTVTVTATSIADSTKTASATIAFQPSGIGISPGNAAPPPSGTQQFTATIGNTSNNAVTWSINPAVGSISSAGLYTAPAFIGSPQAVTVTATSVAAPAESASATVSLVSTGLVGYWPFDETSGSMAHDASGFGNNGNLLCTGNCALATWTTGMRHGALDFTSNPQSVSVADAASLDFSSQFTVSFWLYKTAGASSLYYLTKGSSIAIATASPETEMHVALYSAGAQVARCAISGVADQTWQHFAITFDGSNIVFYVNGVLNTTCAASAAAGMSFSGAVSIGGPNTANLTGILDEVRIYITALSAQQIAAVYNDPGLSSSTAQPAPSVTLSLSPAGANLPSSGTQQFAATVTGASNTAVSWTIAPAVGSISSSGLYTAPASIGAAQTVTVTATSSADPSVSASVTITLQPAMTVTLAPATANAQASGTQQFTPTVTGSSNTAVSWSINPAVGSISSTGLYSAPASIAAAQTVTVTATSAANSSVSASSTVTLQPSAQPGTQTLATFSLTEFFGASWPNQIIEFAYTAGQPNLATTRMIGPAGTEVPYSWAASGTTCPKGCIVVESSLPANAAYTWTLQSGIAPTAVPTHPATLATVGNNFQIANGLTGVAVVTPSANTSPYNQAPIQGIRLPSGTWTGVGSSPNLIYTEAANVAGNTGDGLQTPAYSATGYSCTTLSSGQMKVQISCTYTFNRPQYYYSSTVITAAGAGHYTINLTLYADAKSVIVDEDSDMQFRWFLPVIGQYTPDTMRWKGHGVITDTRCGYDTPFAVSGATNATPIVITGSGSLVNNGQVVSITGVGGNTAANVLNAYAQTSGYPAGQFALYADSGLTQPISGNGAYSGGGTVKPAYQGWEEADPAYEAFQDLVYTADIPPSYQCVANQSYTKLVTDYPPAAPQSGWYFEEYCSTCGSSSPVLGAFQGDFSLNWSGAVGPSEPGPYTSNASFITRTTAAGIERDNLLMAPTAATVSGVNNNVVHINWGLFVSTNADILAANQFQPIMTEQNFKSGINLSRLYTYQLVFPNPPNGWTWQYLPTASMNTLISNVQNGTSVCGSVTCYYNLLYDSDGSSWGRALLNMWQGNSSAAVQTALNTGLQLAQQISQTLASGDNHFDNSLGYYQLGLSTSPETAVLNAVLMNPNATAAQIASAKAALALFGCLFWDDDWFPIDNNTGDSDGLSNQIQQYLQYRTQAAAALPSQPYLASMLTTALTYPTNDFNAYFSATGAAAGSTHYQSAFFEPLILNYLNFSLDGVLSMNNPTWINYANWELSIQTPPEPRFGNYRKGYSNGDGNTEADVRTGMLGTALFATNPSVAGNLMWAWQQSNSPTQVTEDDQFVTTLVAIDPTIPQIAPNLTSTNIPGYHSAERHNFGTPHETSLWFINGDFYSMGGHRHFDDGQVSIYAHSAPLAIDWNPNLYNPQVPGRFMHNAIVLDSELPNSWSADQPSLSAAPYLLQNATNTEFAAFPHSTTSSGTFTERDGTVWTRTVRTLDFDATYPVIYVYDSFAGASATAGKTLTWNLMDTGAVSTPAGSIESIQRFSAGCQSPAGQLPSNGTIFGLNNGLQHFNFTGAPWAAHATGGINWDLYEIPSSGTAQFLIGNWGHGCQASREASEYQTANGAPFAEIQDILRVHDTGPFTTLILPYRKTETPTRTVTTQACGTQVVQGAETSCFNNSAATYTNGTTSILTVYDSSTQSAYGVSATGGPQEVAITATQITWTIGGEKAGARSLTLPVTWYPNQTVSVAGTTYTYNYPGGAQTAPFTVVFSTTPQ